MAQVTIVGAGYVKLFLFTLPYLADCDASTQNHWHGNCLYPLTKPPSHNSREKPPRRWANNWMGQPMGRSQLYRWGLLLSPRGENATWCIFWAVALEYCLPGVEYQTDHYWRFSRRQDGRGYLVEGLYATGTLGCFVWQTFGAVVWRMPSSFVSFLGKSCLKVQRLELPVSQT